MKVTKKPPDVSATPPPLIRPELMQTLLDDLATKGWSCGKELFPTDLLLALRLDAVDKQLAQDFKKARIGRKGTEKLSRSIRGDFIYWLSKDEQHSAVRRYYEYLDVLIQLLARGLLLPIKTFEMHYAIYPPGTGYQKHVDAFLNSTHRLVSVVTFLNDCWTEDDGGQLVIYNDSSPSQIMAKILPEFGTTVIFLSDRIPHEVLATQKQRYSLTGWLRRQAYDVNELL